MLLWFFLSVFYVAFGEWVNSNNQLCSKSSELAKLDNSSNLVFKNFNSFQKLNFFCFNLSGFSLKKIIEFWPSQKLLLDHSLSFRGTESLFKPNQYQIKLFFYFIKGFNSSNLLFKDLNERLTRVEVYFFRSKFDKSCHQCSSFSKGPFDGIGLVEFAFTVKYSLNTCPYIFKNSSIYELKFHGLSKSAIRFNQLSFDASFTNEQVNASVKKLGFYFYKGTLVKSMIIFKYIDKLEILGLIQSIDSYALESIRIKSINLYIDNKLNFLSQGIEWIKRINENLKINFSNKSDIINNMDKATIISFQENKMNGKTDLDWSDDKHFCIFKDFPDNNLVLPAISPRYSSNCSCLLIWLFKKTRIILKHVRIPQVRILNSCSNETLVEIMIKALNILCTDLNVGAVIGDTNLSIIAYCDDIIILSPSEKQATVLLKICEKYAVRWKIDFNASKSAAISFCKRNISSLPIGDQYSVNDYVEEKMKKVERSLYSLRSIGCRPKMMKPETVAFFTNSSANRFSRITWIIFSFVKMI
ncbi:hypothetical protein BpHYR1_049643 [Brachionus plicatilis]|uniref:Uncharacterized protein n=1 Tax=Brachionus plicatilis TaxID=10195 RepID=A0A3M7R584_BRAPC|nr:hypothetical protein BpHYR1_049643 [Brachionus plicatilis]